jgi:hypothetical protein
MDKKTILEFFKLRSLPIPSAINIVDDTTEFMNIDRGDVLMLDNTPYFVKSNEREIGFGMDGDPKYWVKRTLNLNTGELQIIKLVFHEKFSQKVLLKAPEFQAKRLKLNLLSPESRQNCLKRS